MNEQRIGQAVAALRARLEGWGAPDPDAKATDLLHELQTLGWRPTGPDTRPIGAGTRATPEQAHAHAMEARQALRQIMPRPEEEGE